MSTDKIIGIEENIADLKAQWLAHSMPPSMWQQLKELEGELEKAREGRSTIVALLANEALNKSCQVLVIEDITRLA